MALSAADLALDDKGMISYFTDRTEQ
jgi:hypothetical protein